jgi:hypothetical protein
VKKASLIFQVKAEIIKREEMAEDVIVSKLKIIKIGEDYYGDGKIKVKIFQQKIKNPLKNKNLQRMDRQKIMKRL